MKRLLIDASAFITLAEIDAMDLLAALAGEVVVPTAVADEIVDQPAAGHLDEAVAEGWIRFELADDARALDHAAAHLGVEAESSGGDVALLALALVDELAVVVTDDKPLRKTCRALSVPISGSIGVLIAAVERGALTPDEAKDALVAMDEVGARLSARLLRRAERLIDDAAKDAG